MTHLCQILKFRPKMTPNTVIWPPRCPVIGFPSALLCKWYSKKGSKFILNVCCCYYVLFSGPNWEIFRIMWIFWAIFCQNMGTWPSRMPIYRVLPKWYAIDIKYLESRFNLVCIFMVTMCDVMAQTVRLLAKYPHLRYFLVKTWVFDPLGCNF